MAPDEQFSVDLIEKFRTKINEIPDDHKPLVRRTFQAIRSAERGLTLDELNILVSLDIGHTYTTHLKNTCHFSNGKVLKAKTHDLARVQNGCVAFQHDCLYEILAKGRDKSDRNDGTWFQATLVEDQRFLARQSMRYLLLKDFVGSNDDSDSSIMEMPSLDGGDDHHDNRVIESDADAEKSKKAFKALPFGHQDRAHSATDDTNFNRPAVVRSALQSEQKHAKMMADTYPLLEYAARFWTSHYRQCEGDNDPIMKSLARRILEPSDHMNWLQHLYEIETLEMNFPEQPSLLILASYFGLHSIIKDIPCKEVASEALYWAAWNGHSKAVDELLGKAEASDKPDWLAQRALFDAIQQDHAAVAKVWIDRRPMSIVQTGPSGLTPLAAAVSAGSAETMREILSFPNSNPNAAETILAAPLFCTLVSGSSQCLKLLLDDKRTDVTQLDWDERSLLSLACEQGRTDLVKTIVADGRIELNAQDDRGRTPLMYAVAKRRKDIVDFLLQQKQAIDVQVRDFRGRNALSLAASTSTPEIFERLLDADESCASVECKEGFTSVEWTLDPPESPGNAKVLLRRIPEKFEAEAGLKLFAYALSWGAVEIATLLIIRQAFDINVVSSERETKGNTALSYAFRHAEKNKNNNVLGPLKAVLGAHGLNLALGVGAPDLESFVQDCVGDDKEELTWLMSKAYDGSGLPFPNEV
jgi:ankyrin repeat protein